MQLIYRGATYDYNFLKASSRPMHRATPYNLHYRGNTYQVDRKSKAPEVLVQTVTHQLIYRGNTYSVTRTVAVEATITSNHRSELVMQTL